MSCRILNCSTFLSPSDSDSMILLKNKTKKGLKGKKSDIGEKKSKKGFLLATNGK
jgi:hypothetical protein